MSDVTSVDIRPADPAARASLVLVRAMEAEVEF